jgi:hypothetical protein
MIELEAIVSTRDELHELFRPVKAYADSCRAERVDADFLAIQTLPIDLAFAGYKVSVFQHLPGEWRISIERRINGQSWQVLGRGSDFVEAFASLERAARKSLERLTSKLLSAVPEEVAA